MGSEALLPLLMWVAWKPTAEPTLAQAELQTDPQLLRWLLLPCDHIPLVAVLVSNNTSALW